MKNSEIRAEARNLLYDNWGKYIGLNFLYFLVIFGVTFVLTLIPIIGPILSFVFSLVCTVPLAYGYAMNFVKIRKDPSASCIDFLELGFSNFGKAWALAGWSIVKLLVPTLLVFGSAIIAAVYMGTIVADGDIPTLGNIMLVYLILLPSYIFLYARTLLYAFAQYAAIYNPNIRARDCYTYSAKLMKGKRWKYIGLSLSFFGWMLTGLITCGVSYIFLMPYISLASLCFYESLAGENNDSPNVMDWDSVNAVMENK
ncbi:MAG: DUF975 family protein [Clostridia bacterium]|nr:DUF975 family protein [Clostridia bacterium]